MTYCGSYPISDEQPTIQAQEMSTTIPDAADETPEHLTAEMMTAVLRAMLVFLGIEWGVMVPFLSPNSTATAYLLAFATVTMLAVPWPLLRKRRPVLAASVFLAGGALVATILGLLGRGGVKNSATTLQLAIVGIASVVLGSRPALWIAVLCMAADLASASAELLGHPLPVVFHGTPLSIWVSAVFFFILMANPMNRAMRILRRLSAERANAEEALRRSEERLRLIAETAPIGIVVFDVAGRVVYANHFATRVMGCDLAGRDEPEWEFTDVDGNPLPPEQRPFFKVLATRQPLVDTKFAVRVAGGRRVYVSTNTAPIRGAGEELQGVVSVMEDITERRELEERYLQAQKMQSLGRLAGSVGHDFNNLLTVINGFGHLLLNEVKPDDSRRSYVESIVKTGEKAAELTNQLLVFSRQQILQRKVLDVNAVIEDLRPMLMRVVAENIDLQFVFGENRAHVFANPNQIEQVIMNLVVNARDAMPLGGSLLVETVNVQWDQEYVRVHPEARLGRYVELTVKDTGSGMDEQTRRSMFEPFFTTKGVGKGTGLGLSIVLGIVEQIGGYITAQSALGHGTTFRIYLPEAEGALLDSAPASTHEQPAAPVTNRRKSVLVVEDQPGVLEYVALALKGQGYRVTAAASCAAAIAVFVKNNAGFDLILTDVMMPGMKGWELAAHLQHIRPSLKVLFMSGYTDDDINISSRDTDIIMKPFSPEQLGAKVRDALAE